MRLIDADALPTLATELRLSNGKTKHFVGVEFDDIRNAPTIDPFKDKSREQLMKERFNEEYREAVKHGKWEDKSVCDGDAIDAWQEARCSACGLYHTTPYMYYFDEFTYCPNCGAKMDGGTDNGTD